MYCRNILLIGKAGTLSIGTHWGLALFSLATAFAIWFAVQDVENPRAEAEVPLDTEQSIPVTAINVPDGFIVVRTDPVRLLVRAREDDLPTLRAADFRATVDVQSLTSAQTTSLPVTVESRRDNVQVVSINPATVQVTIVEAITESRPVVIDPRGSLPDGYKLLENETIEPRSVNVTGLPELVDSVQEVVLEIQLNGLKDDTVEIEGDLIARDRTGNDVGVTLSEERAKVTLRIEQTNLRRTMVVDPDPRGTPAPGYRISNITIEPSVIGVSGTKAIMDSLTQLRTLPVDITGANTDVVVERAIDKPPGVTLDRQSVSVRISISKIECVTKCGTILVRVPITPTDFPSGLALDSGVYVATVRVTASPSVALDPNQIRATISFAGAVQGIAAAYTPTVTAPQGVTIESVDPMTIKLIPAVLSP